MFLSSIQKRECPMTENNRWPSSQKKEPQCRSRRQFLKVAGGATVTLALSNFWFHPLLWWASFRSNLSREFLCDEAAAGDPSNIAAYLQTMLALAEQKLSRRYDSMTALAFGRGKGVIARRIQRLVELARKRTTPQHPVLRSRMMPVLLVPITSRN